MIYKRWYLVNPHVQTVQNMFGKGGYRVYKAELRPPKVDPYFKQVFFISKGMLNILNYWLTQ